MSPAEYRAHREKLGLTQAGLAALLGVSRETVNRRESGEQPITHEAALALDALQARRERLARKKCAAMQAPNTRTTLAAIRAQLGVRRLDPRRLFLVNDGAYTWLGDRADLTAETARMFRLAHREGSRPDLVSDAERREADAAWGADWYSRACASITCVASTSGAGEDLTALPDDWRDGSALGPILPLYLRRATR